MVIDDCYDGNDIISGIMKLRIRRWIDSPIKIPS